MQKTGKIIICGFCKKEVYRRPSFLKYKQNFCSTRCKKLGWIPWNKGNRKYYGICGVCGKMWTSVGKRKYCSHKCYTSSPEFLTQVSQNGKSLKGKRHVNNIMDNGYIMIYQPNHPDAKRTSPVGYVYEHRIVLEIKLGRHLSKEEIVHHLNGVKTDNRPENLVVTTRKDHMNYHGDILKRNINKAIESVRNGSTRGKKIRRRYERYLDA